jgi:hypothetical protein
MVQFEWGVAQKWGVYTRDTLNPIGRSKKAGRNRLYDPANPQNEKAAIFASHTETAIGKAS